jgi:hypothetical protein
MQTIVEMESEQGETENDDSRALPSFNLGQSQHTIDLEESKTT